MLQGRASLDYPTRLQVRHEVMVSDSCSPLKATTVTKRMQSADCLSALTHTTFRARVAATMDTAAAARPGPLSYLSFQVFYAVLRFFAWQFLCNITRRDFTTGHICHEPKTLLQELKEGLIRLSLVASTRGLKHLEQTLTLSQTSINIQLVWAIMLWQDWPYHFH